MNRFILWGHRLLLVFSVLIAALVFLYLLVIAAFGGVDSPIIIYPLVFSSVIDTTIKTVVVSGFFVIGILFAVLAIGSRLLFGIHGHRKIGAFLVAMMVFSGALWTCSFLCSSVQGQIGSGWIFMDHVDYRNHTYRLILFSHGWENTWSYSYRLYDCDHMNLFCSRLPMPPLSGSGNLDADRQSRLVTNATDNRLSLEIKGTLVYTYSLP